jgi:primosomal protein N' (replication factor Y)
MTIALGDVVRVPLGPKRVYGYALSDGRVFAGDDAKLRDVEQRVDGPRAFDATGLALARFIADTYVCSLREALGAVVLSGAVPRAVDTIRVAVDRPPESLPTNVPPRLVALLWSDARDGIGMEALLRHPEARRAGDRRALLAAVTALVAAGVVTRERTFARPTIAARRVRLLRAGAATIAGVKANALVAFVRDATEVRRGDATLAGFSSALVRRAVKAGALVEDERDLVALRGPMRARLPDVVPTDEQLVAIDAVRDLVQKKTYGQVLVHGITGSGKTYVYLAAIADVLALGGRAIVLVPEIALTPQTARRFEEAFGDRVAIVHSALSERERFEAWQAAARGDVAVVVGARSAVFAPLDDVRLIVVDEEHETSYKQDTVPRYNAVAVARERMRLAGGVVVLGSATPALEDYAKARARRFPLVTLTRRATALPLPTVHVVDLSKERGLGERSIFAAPLTEAIGKRIAAGEKTVLFVNRRGAARFLLCRACAHVPECPRCSTSLAAHRVERLLRCHYCDFQLPIPTVCSQCGHAEIKEYGLGTERVADEVVRLFPAARVVRMDSDTTTRVGDHARLLESFRETGDVLVGTQMVAKGLDFAGVTLAGVVEADVGLHVPDFRAAERTFALIMQVCGRSGRARLGEAFVQTYAPDHPAITYAAAHDYDGFAIHELRERKALGYPPYGAIVYVGIIGRDRAAVIERAEAHAIALRASDAGEILGPAPAPVARLNDEWRYRIAVKTRDVERTRAAIRETVLPAAGRDTATRTAINVDP